MLGNPVAPGETIADQSRIIAVSGNLHQHLFELAAVPEFYENSGYASSATTWGIHLETGDHISVKAATSTIVPPVDINASSYVDIFLDRADSSLNGLYQLGKIQGQPTLLVNPESRRDGFDVDKIFDVTDTSSPHDLMQWLSGALAYASSISEKTEAGLSAQVSRRGRGYIRSSDFVTIFSAGGMSVISETSLSYISPTDSVAVAYDARSYQRADQEQVVEVSYGALSQNGSRRRQLTENDLMYVQSYGSLILDHEAA